MNSLSIPAGTTSRILDVFIKDSTRTDGSGLGSLTYDTASLVGYWMRDTDVAATALTLVAATPGTYTESGFVADDSNMPGWYQLGIPDAAIASGAKSVRVMLYGALTMDSTNIEVELTGDVAANVVQVGGASLGAHASGMFPADVRNWLGDTPVEPSVSPTFAIVVNVTDGSDPVEGAFVRLRSDEWFTGSTDGSGNVTLNPVAGIYSLMVVKNGYSYAPTTQTLTEAGTIDVVMTAL